MGWRRSRRSGRQSQGANRHRARPYGQRRRRQSQGANRPRYQISRSCSQRATSACHQRHQRTWRERTRRCFCFFGVHSDWIFVRADQLARGDGMALSHITCRLAEIALAWNGTCTRRSRPISRWAPRGRTWLGGALPFFITLTHGVRQWRGRERKRKRPSWRRRSGPTSWHHWSTTARPIRRSRQLVGASLEVVVDRTSRSCRSPIQKPETRTEIVFNSEKLTVASGF